jgi:hypothetical protein
LPVLEIGAGIILAVLVLAFWRIVVVLAGLGILALGLIANPDANLGLSLICFAIGGLVALCGFKLLNDW